MQIKLHMWAISIERGWNSTFIAFVRMGVGNPQFPVSPVWVSRISGAILIRRYVVIAKARRPVAIYDFKRYGGGNQCATARSGKYMQKGKPLSKQPN